MITKGESEVTQLQTKHLLYLEEARNRFSSQNFQKEPNLTTLNFTATDFFKFLALQNCKKITHIIFGKQYYDNAIAQT